MHIKRMNDMLEKLVEGSNLQFSKGMEQIDTEEMKSVICMIKELSEALYYSTITKAMEDYDYTDDERRYYDRYRYSNGRFAPKGSGRIMRYSEPNSLNNEVFNYNRDLDRDIGRMYYTEPNTRNSNNSNESRIERARRNFEEHMNKHDSTPEGKQKEAELLADLFDSATEVIMMYKPEMNNATKTMIARKMTNASEKISQ